MDAAGCHGSKHPAKLKQRQGSSWPSENATGFRAKPERDAIGGSSAILNDSQPLSHPHRNTHALTHTLAQHALRHSETDRLILYSCRQLKQADLPSECRDSYCKSANQIQELCKGPKNWSRNPSPLWQVMF